MWFFVLLASHSADKTECVLKDGKPCKHEMLQELLRRQIVLTRFGELALRSDDLDAILTEACHLVREALDTDLAKVIELQEDQVTLLVRAGVGWKPGVVGIATIYAADDTSEGHALKLQEPVISPDIETETRFRYPAYLTDNGVRAFVKCDHQGRQGQAAVRHSAGR